MLDFAAHCRYIGGTPEPTRLDIYLRLSGSRPSAMTECEGPLVPATRRAIALGPIPADTQANPIALGPSSGDSEAPS